MRKFFIRSVTLVALLFWGTVMVYAQTNISGKVKDTTGESLAGVNIVVKGKVIGTISGSDGSFSLKVTDSPPLTLVFSFVGYKTTEVAINEANTTTLEVTMEEQTLLGQEVVVSASRVEESILQSPVTIEKIDLLAIQQTPAPEFYDALANVKGVQFTSSSLNFPQVNTRGFATIANVRFVQLVDGMDTSAPLLNFPTGNIVGIGELDAESMELVPGAASALYGPNAFNGILIMRSKSPFEYQGLSAQAKTGITTSDAQGESYPYYNFSLRYAKAFNNKFAFKVNFAFMDAEDWRGNDYQTDVNNPESVVDLSSQPNFDGLNLYGDETRIPVPIGGPFGTLDLRRTGFKEGDIVDNYDAKSLKGDLALHYRLTDRIEASLNYRYGGGSSIYQGSQKYALRNFTQAFYKAEVKGDNFFVRGYVTATDAGDSYNIGALGAYMNERYSDTRTQWAPEYAQTYVLAMQGYVSGVPAGNPEAAHAAARAYADRNRPQPGTAAFNQLREDVQNSFFQRNPPGAKFTDNSRLYHGEFNYNFKNQVEFVEIIVGGNVRQYSLFSDGTVFNEDPDGDNNFERININEFGVYTQLSKTLADALKLTGSIRFDKNENFEGRITPRVSAVYTLQQNHNIRASFQTGFRNPDTQAQFIYFPVGTNTLLGSTEANAARYGVHNGGAWTRASYEAYLASGGTLQGPTGTPTGGNSALLQTANIPYVKPEQLRAIEIGYKGLFTTKMLVDLNAYFNSYKNFIGSLDIASKNETTHRGQTLPAGTIFSPYVNSAATVTSMGIGLGVTYNLPKGYQLTANYNYATFDEDKDQDPNFRAGFNTPENKVSVGIGNRKVVKNVGFNVNFRYQDEFLWQSDFGEWNVPAFGVVDAQVNYRLASLKSMLKLGGSNLFGGDYRTNLGGPFVGQQYYVSITFDEFFK